MKGPLALLLCLPLIIWLWRRDKAVRPAFSPALWLPILWLLVLGSRPLSFWLGVGGGSSSLEGNSFDAILYLAQMFAALYVLSIRRFQWSNLFQRNNALMFFYLFLLITVLWSPYPWSSFKRWFKDLGSVFAILVIFTEKHPLEAVKAVFARCAYVLMPLSVVCLKFFPSIGRSFSHSGVMFTGVTVHKNSLGEIALIFGLFLLAEAIQPNRPAGTSWFRGHRLTTLITLAMSLYLLVVCDSKTSLVCFLAGAIIVAGHKLPLLKGHPLRIVGIFLVGVPLFFLADSIFQISDYLLSLIGKNATLTDRTNLWEAIGNNPVNPVIGTGYMMYWDTHQDLYIGEYGSETAGWKSAHNGYLESYLDGGFLLILLLAVLLFAVGWRAIREFLTNSQYGRLAFAFFVVMVFYNVSESMFARRSPLWFAFLLLALEFRRGTFDSTDNRLDDYEPAPAV